MERLVDPEKGNALQEMPSVEVEEMLGIQRARRRARGIRQVDQPPLPQQVSQGRESDGREPKDHDHQEQGRQPAVVAITHEVLQ